MTTHNDSLAAWERELFGAVKPDFQVENHGDFLVSFHKHLDRGTQSVVSKIARAYLGIEQAPGEFELMTQGRKVLQMTLKSQILLARLFEILTPENGWRIFPESDSSGVIVHPETQETVKTIDQYSILRAYNEKLDKLLHIYREEKFEVRFFSYGSVGEELTTAQFEQDINMFLLPDPFENKVLLMGVEGIEIMSRPDLSHLTGYAEDVESAIDWAMSLSNMEIVKSLESRGLPTRAGLLLEGPPGSGKTTLLRRVAFEAKDKGATVLIASAGTPILELIEFITAYEFGVLILEDVESFFAARGSQSFANFLEALDGIEENSRLVVIASSNDSSKFDAAIRRPGRLERTAVIANIHEKAQLNMIKQRFPEYSEELCLRIVDEVKRKIEGDITPAIVDSLCRYIVMCGVTEEEVISYIEKQWTVSYKGQSYV